MSNGAETSNNDQKVEELEEMFKDRYTTDNERFKKISEGFEKPVVVHPWTPRQFADRRPYRGRGGGGGRGDWRGGGGGGRGHYQNNYHNNRGNYGNNYNNQRGGYRGGRGGGGGGGGGWSGHWRGGDRKRPNERD